MNFCVIYLVECCFQHITHMKLYFINLSDIVNDYLCKN